MNKLNASTVARPELPITILQFGAGNFLRAFVGSSIFSVVSPKNK